MGIPELLSLISSANSSVEMSKGIRLIITFRWTMVHGISILYFDSCHSGLSMTELACPRDSKKIAHLILPILSNSVYLTPILYKALATSRSLGGFFSLSAVRSLTDKIALNGPQSVFEKCVTDFPAGSVDTCNLLFSVGILSLARL